MLVFGSGAEMDEPRELKRPPPPPSPTDRPSLTRSRGVPPSHGNAKRYHLFFTGAVCGDHTDLMDDGWRKRDKHKGAKGGSSSSDDGEMGLGGGDHEVVRPPPAPAVTTDDGSKKRVKFNGKVANDYVPVDPALVPRRLRSAICKRGYEPAACPPPAPLKRFNLVHGGTSGLKKSKQSMVVETLTRDEEEVIETLSTLASIVTECKRVIDVTDRRRMAAENVVDDPKEETTSMETISKIHPEGTNQVDAKFPSSTSIAGESITFTSHSSHHMESFEKDQVCNASTRDDDYDDAIEHPKTIRRSGIIPNIDLDMSNNAAKEEEEATHERSSSMNNSECSLKPNGDGTNISYGVGNLLHALPSKGKFQVTQLQRRLPSEPARIGLPLSTSTTTRQKNRASKEGSCDHLAAGDEPSSNRWSMAAASASSRDNPLRETLLTRASTSQDSACCVGRSDAAPTEPSAERSLMDAAHGKGRRKRCGATHVYISRMIRRCQDAERKRDGHHQIKLREGGGGGSIGQRLLPLHDGRMKQHPTLSRAFSQMTLDFMSYVPGNKSKLSPSPAPALSTWSSSSSGYLQPFALHQHTMMRMTAFPPEQPQALISSRHQHHHHFRRRRRPPHPSSSSSCSASSTGNPRAPIASPAHRQQAAAHHGRPGVCTDRRLQLCNAQRI